MDTILKIIIAHIMITHRLIHKVIVIKKDNMSNGEEIKFKSFVAKDTVKERYPKYCKLD